MMATQGALVVKNGMPAHTVAHDFINGTQKAKRPSVSAEPLLDRFDPLTLP